MYKLLLLDVDGTLLKHKGDSVSPGIKQAVAEIKDRVHVSLCTGRTHHDAKQVIDDLGIVNSYHVIESGAKVLNPQGEEENVKSISMVDIEWILTEAGSNPAGYGFCTNGIWLDSQDKIGSGLVTTVALHSHSKQQTDLIMSKLERVGDKYHIGVGSHWQIKEGAFILITNKEASKKSAIEYIQHKLAITKEETMGIGDMLNDLPLFEASGLKVAMGNGVQLLKDKADYVTPSIDDDGVTVAIHEHLLSVS